VKEKSKKEKRKEKQLERSGKKREWIENK